MTNVDTCNLKATKIGKMVDAWQILVLIPGRPRL